jgi:hypothetical protein
MARLDTNDLEALMHGDPEFVGVFSRDTIPRGIDKRLSIKMIVNLDPKNLPGSHWVAISRRGGKAYYFDTFGRPPPKEISDWLSNNSLSWTYFKNIIQAPNDTTSCGYICLSFLNQLS